MKLSSLIESILFISGEPVSMARLMKLAKKSADEVTAALEELAVGLEGRGIILARKDDEVVLATSPAAATVVSEIAAEEYARDLTRAALETLAIIIYKGPLSRSEIDFIRGVNSSFSIRNLMVRGLVERIPNPKHARTFLYRPSMELLAYLGVAKIEDIPEYRDFRAKMDEHLKSIEKSIEVQPQ